MSEFVANDVLVIVEGVDPQRDRIAAEQIATGQALAAATGGKLTVGVIGADAAGRAGQFAGYAGVAEVLSVADPVLTPHVNGPRLRAATALASSAAAGIVLLPASLTGRDLAPRLAIRIGAAMISDAIGFDIADNGQRRFQRQVAGGKLVSWVTAGSFRQVVVTMRAGTNRQAPEKGGTAPIRELHIEFTAKDRAVECLESVEAEKEAAGIATAARIVSGGRGLGKPEHFHLIEALAQELDAAVGASGAVVGLGWRPHSQQVGSTGTTVTPRLYLAVGISGAVQHTIGMAGSDNIVAINRDPAAPIFQIASLGVVGDLFELVPALIAELRAARA
jgi:electron transfer flavoprotein alpha subunit